MGLGHSPIVVSEGLVFYFDPINTRSYAGTGLTGFNLINTAIVGAFTNGPVYDSANKGSINFDGVDDRISFSFNSALDISQSITIEAYIKPKSYPTAGGGGMILTKVASYYLEFASTGKIRVYFDGLNSPGYHDSVNTVPLNKWTHVVVTRDSSNSTINIYINGVLDKTVTGITGNISVQQTWNLAMGGYNGGGYLFVGLITCGKIYNRALSASEILQNYNVTKKRFSPEENIVTNGLVLNIDAGNTRSYAGVGNTAYDIAGTGITASLFNGVGFNNANNGSFSFDGTNDYIEFLPSSIFNLGTGDFTFLAWHKTTNKSGYSTILSIDDGNGTGIIFYTNIGSGVFRNWVAGQARNGNIDICTGIWNLVALTRSSGNCTQFVNGVSDVTFSAAGSLSVSGRSLFVGKILNELYYNGNISQVQIYNKALSSTEILQNYNALKSRYGLS